jgi:hypothetical protein
MWAKVVKIFCPLTIHSSPSCSERVAQANTSDPPAGSVYPRQISVSPAVTPGRILRLSSSEPVALIAFAQGVHQHSRLERVEAGAALFDGPRRRYPPAVAELAGQRSVNPVAAATFVLDQFTGDVPGDELLGLTPDASPVRGFGEVHRFSDLPL